MSNKLFLKVKNLSKTPGVYQFIDSAGGILYIGKAKNLKSRIKSYFVQEIKRGPSIEIMVSLAVDVKIIETESEIEAVILEAELIKKLKPKYNIKLKDDKSFLVIKISKKNLRPEFPIVELIRANNVNFEDENAEYFGPYPSGLLLKKSLSYLRKIFPYRDCSNTKFCDQKRKNRPCIYGDIRVCTAPCVDWVNEKQYLENIKFLKQFLRGDKKKIYNVLQKQMKSLSSKKRFEEAALVRDKVMALDHLKVVAVGLRDDVFNSANILFKRIECYDISNIGDKYAVGSMVVFQDGKKSTDEYRHFKIKNSSEESDLARLKEMLKRRFKNNWPLADLIVIDGGINQLNITKEILKESKLNIPVLSIAKGAERKKNEFHYGDSNLAKYVAVNQNLINILISARDEAHRFAIKYYRSLHQKDLLK